MIKLLNVISGLNNAGTEAVVMNYYRNIDRSEIQFDFLVLNEGNGYYEAEIKSLGGNIYKIPNFTSNPLKNMILKKKFFKEHKYDIVEVHTPSILRYKYCELAKKSGAKVVFHLHSAQKVNGIIKRIALAKLRKYCDEIVACSQYAAIEAIGEKADKIVYNAIDFDKYRFDDGLRRDVRAKLGLTENDYIIGHIGRFSKVKNQKFLISLMQALKSSSENIKLILKGFGEDEEELRSIIKAERLQESVIIISGEYTANQLYNAFDVFVLPSFWEGLPMVAVEAQANGLFVIASDKVTDEINITGRVKRLELNKEIWVKNLLNTKEYCRKQIDLNNWQKTGYEITSEAAQRLTDYKNMIEK